MSKLGVSTFYTRERNLAIIREKYKRNPNRTRAQVNFLARFPNFHHKKGLNYRTGCRCLRCEGLEMIDRQLVDDE